MISFFTICLTICRLANCASTISANFDSKKTNSTILGLVTRLKMMIFVGVLNFAVLQIVPPNEYSTIPGTFVVKGHVCCVDPSCHLLEYREHVLVFLTCVDFPVPFFASCCPGLCHSGPTCLFESRLRKRSRFTHHSLGHCGALRLMSNCAMWSKYLTHASDQ